MKTGVTSSFGAYLKALRVTAGFTQEELATIAGLSVHAVSALERGERRRPHVDTVRALAGALNLEGEARDALVKAARTTDDDAAADELAGGSLPLASTGLLGRDVDVQTLRQWLDGRSARLITLVGPGGVGKTRLALEIARRFAEEGASRVVFVELAAVRDSAFVALAIAEALGLSDVTTADLPRRVRAACERQPAFVVLDNCEQVLDAGPLIADLLVTAPSLQLLATSRAPFRVRGERLYMVGPLALRVDGPLTAPADLVENPAVRLFVERARDVQPDFQLTPANGRTVAEICRRLDALPLALELAAPWIKVLTTDGLLARLERDVLLPPTVAPRDLPERQQGIGTTVAWSYQLLRPDEQRAFRRFGLLPGRFPLEAAAAVLAGAQGPSGDDHALRAAAALIEKSLLHQEQDSVRKRPLYRMLETVRAYAALELVATGEHDDALEGLTRYCSAEASRAEGELVGPAQLEWLDRVRDDLDNYRYTLMWLIEHGRYTEACDIAWHLQFFWLIRGRSAEGLQWYGRVLDSPGLSSGAECRALLGTAVMTYTQGDIERSRQSLTRALTIAQDGGETALVVQGENLLGHLENTSGNVTRARELFGRCVTGFAALSAPWGIGNALIGMAVIALAGNDVKSAERLLDEATSVLRAAGPWFLNLPLYIRAIVAVRRGSADDAIQLAHESLTCSRQLRDRFAFVYALTPLAAAAALKGDYPWVARILGARDAVTERTGSTVATAWVQDLRQQAEQRARESLGATRWARAYAAGRRASIDSLVADIEIARGARGA
jgi:predicted ATPase/DNA-binding XRE family transcriptional regulator